MKIRPLKIENRDKVYALLKNVFPKSKSEKRLIELLHENKRQMLEWICIHKNMVVSYICFTNAYEKGKLCGLHLSLLIVKREFQNQGIAAELLRFALRQEEIKSKTIFVLGNEHFYKNFGFELSNIPICEFDNKNANFLSLRNRTISNYKIGYESEFKKNTGWYRNIINFYDEE